MSVSASLPISNTEISRNFRITLLEGINRVLMGQQAGPPKLRVKHEALLLTAACVWLVNGLHARPDDGSAARSLMRATLPLTDAAQPDLNTVLFLAREGSGDEIDDDESSLPFNPFGAIFLRRVVLDVEVPRMRVTTPASVLSADAFQFFFNMTEQEVRYRYSPVGILPRGAVSRRRVVTNKTKRTVPIHIQDVSILFDLSSKGHVLPNSPVDSGSDMEISDSEGIRAASSDIDAKISQMWHQFLVDVVNRSPSPKGAGRASYLKLTVEEKLQVTEDLYMNLKLSDMWREVSWKVATPADRKLAFEHLFPDREHETSSRVQNYTQCRYYITWKEISVTAAPTTVEAIRVQLLKKVNALNWIPFASGDKIWQTQQKIKNFTRFPPGSDGPAPHILCRGRPSWEAP